MSDKCNHKSAEQVQAEEQHRLEELNKEKSAQIEEESARIEARLERLILEEAQIAEEAGNE